MTAHDDRFLNAVTIPEGTSGKIRIAHVKKPAGEVFKLASSRTAIMGGDQGKPVSWPHETTWHQLSEEDQGVWMTDLPIEQHQARQQADGVKRGHVLVGGLGLGVVAAILSKKRDVKSITIVEKNDDVVCLVAPYLRLPKVEYVTADLFQFLKDKPGQFDQAFYDIWQSDGEGTFFDTVVPLLAASDGVVKSRPVCWNENVMRGQLYHGLRSGLEMTTPEAAKMFPNVPTREQMATPRGDKWWDWKVPFWKWVQKVKGPEAYLMDAMKFYVSLYGIPNFEQIWENYK